MKHELTLPWPPSVNHYWRHWQGRMVIGAAGKEFRKRVAGQVGTLVPLEGRLCVRLAIYPPDRRKRDIDNLAKAVLDVLTNVGAYRDDSQIDELHLRRMEVVAGGEVYVEVMTCS